MALLSKPPLDREGYVEHLVRMESQLAETQATVASLRALLERPEAPISVGFRSVPRTSTLAIGEIVSVADLESWGAKAFEELAAALASTGTELAGPTGALFSDEIFEDEVGEVVAFIPVTGPRAIVGRVRRVSPRQWSVRGKGHCAATTSASSTFPWIALTLP